MKSFPNLAVLGTLLGLAGALPVAHAAVSINAGGQGYSQNFDSLATSGATNAWVNDSTLAGWSLFRQPVPGTAITAYAAGDGSSNSGSFYSFGSAGSSDRALGGLGSGGSYFGSPASGTVAGWIAASFKNSSGSALNGFSLSFDGEQWRNGGNTSAQTTVFEYGYGASFASVASWTAPGGGFDFTSPTHTATAGLLNGNLAANRSAGLGGAVVGPWSANDTLWLRWIERNDVANDHGLAIDNLRFTAGSAVTAVPEPTTAALMAAGLVAVVMLSKRRLQRR